MLFKAATGALAGGIAAAVVACWGDEDGLTARSRRELAGAIYFVSEQSGVPKTYSIKPDGTALAALFPAEKSPDYPYGVSADRSAIAIVRGDEAEHDVLLVAPDGREPRIVAGDDGIDGSPAFSPDGKWVLFESARHAFRELYKMPVEGGDAVRLTDNREGNFDGAWSPDGSRIAFASSRHGQLDLFVMDADGTDQHRLTSHPGDSIKPAWSPDGSWIAFVSGRDGDDDVFVIRPDGSELRNLTAAQRVEERFAWRPNSLEIAYSTLERSGKKKIRVVSVETGADRALSGETDDDFDPAWSPDGAYLAFASQAKRGQPDIWIMRADGRHRTRLTHDPRGAWLPRWLDVGQR